MAEIYVPLNKTSIKQHENFEYYKSRVVHLLSQSFHVHYSQPWQLQDTRGQENKWVTLDGSTYLNGTFRLFKSDKQFKYQNLIGQFSNTLSKQPNFPNEFPYFDPPVMFYLMFSTPCIIDKITITFDQLLNEYSPNFDIIFLDEGLQKIVERNITTNQIITEINCSDWLSEKEYLRVKFIQIKIQTWNHQSRMQKIHEINIEARFKQDLNSKEYYLSSTLPQKSQQIYTKNQHPLSTPETVLIKHTSTYIPNFLDHNLLLSEMPTVQQLDTNTQYYLSYGIFSAEKQKQNKFFENPLEIFIYFQNPVQLKGFLKRMRIYFDVLNNEYQESIEVSVYFSEPAGSINKVTQSVNGINSQIYTIDFESLFQSLFQIYNEVKCNQIRIVIKSWSQSNRVQKISKIEFLNSENYFVQYGYLTQKQFFELNMIKPESDQQFYIGVVFRPISNLLQNKRQTIIMNQHTNDEIIEEKFYIQFDGLLPQQHQFIINKDIIKCVKIEIIVPLNEEQMTLDLHPLLYENNLIQVHLNQKILRAV